eukprot:587700-Rhodomonas_salina.1
MLSLEVGGVCWVCGVSAGVEGWGLSGWRGGTGSKRGARGMERKAGQAGRAEREDSGTRTEGRESKVMSGERREGGQWDERG